MKTENRIKIKIKTEKIKIKIKSLTYIYRIHCRWHEQRNKGTKEQWSKMDDLGERSSPRERDNNYSYRSDLRWMIERETSNTLIWSEMDEGVRENLVWDEKEKRERHHRQRDEMKGRDNELNKAWMSEAWIRLDFSFYMRQEIILCGKLYSINIDYF